MANESFIASANSNSRQPIGKVIFYFDDPVGVVEFNRHDFLIDFETLLETSADSKLPYGSISANECTISLNNKDRRFSYDSVSSPYYYVLYKNVRVEIFSGFIIDGAEVYEQLGEFWIDRIEAPTDTIVATITCYDKLYKVGNGPMPTLPIYENTTLLNLFKELFLAVGLTESEFVIDDALSIPLQYTSVVAERVKEGLQKMAIAGMASVYTDTKGIIRVKYMYKWRNYKYKLTDSDQIISTTNTRSGDETYNDVIVSYYYPLIKNQETLLTLTDVAVQPGTTVLSNVALDKKPISEVLWVTANSQSRDLTVTIDDYSANTVSLSIINKAKAAEVTLTVVGNYVLPKQMQTNLCTEDATPATKKSLSVDNEYVQDYETALLLAHGILTYVSDQYKAYELKIRGNPLYNLNDVVRINDATHNILDTDLVISRLKYTYAGTLRCEMKAHKLIIPKCYVMISPGFWVEYPYNYEEEV